MTKEKREDIDRLLNYAVKNGFIDESAYEWTDKQKEDYYNKCE